MADGRAIGIPRDLRINERLQQAGLTAHYRPGTSDERVLSEVLFDNPYRRVRMNFFVESGERWLDLGANIGAFALYCQMHGATAECYEPDPDCFQILQQNVPHFELHQCAVTVSREPFIAFWDSKDPNSHHRATAFPMKMAPRHSFGTLPNVCGDIFVGRQFDGVKMDIEGSEGGLLDAGYLPECNKLVLEYHLWRDSSMTNLRRRLDYLRSKFRVVSYPPEFDRMLASGYEHAQSYYDRLIFCMK